MKFLLQLHKAALIMVVLAASPMALHAQSQHVQPVEVLPVRISEGAQSLNGTWKFKYLPTLNAGNDEKFTQPAFNVSTWKTMPVPGHWELQGFAEPEYADNVKEGLGLYRRTFRTPPGWNGQRVFLRFDGVLYGYTAFVNGQNIGEWASSYNAATFNITDALVRGGENVIAVRVSTRNRGWNFDNMDSWSLSGIFRDVTLFALPPLHFHDYTVRTTLQSDGAAHLHLDVVASASGTVTGRLLAPDGQPVKSWNMNLGQDGRGATEIVVNGPQLWTAETPALYRLELELHNGGKTVQRFTDRIGLRQITTDGGILKLNGTPIKLRGVNLHELWPDGQISSEEKVRRDLELIRAANINFIRTSHYPQHPRLLELCDEMGFYVDDEVPYIHGRKWLEDPSYLADLRTRARATVTRDKNRASVLFWSLGNENPVTENGNATGDYVKELDPTRPFTFPTIGKTFDSYLNQFPASMELFAPHYPTLKDARRWAQTLQNPIVFTEYAHQRGLARGGTAVQDLWDEFYRQPRIAGGAIWVFQDQGLLRSNADKMGVKDADLMVWLDDHHYYDTRGFFGMDGLVYSDRTPQLDYWQVRKVYSPVQIAQKSFPAEPGAQTLAISVENRYDFRSLRGIKLNWALQKNGTVVQSGVVTLSAPAKQKQSVPVTVTLPTNLGDDVFALELRCTDERGRQFYERTLRLDAGTPSAKWSALQAALPAGDTTMEVSPARIAVRAPNYQLRLNRQSGQMSLLDSGRKPLITDFGPHVGRNPTINDLGKNREREPQLWRGNLLREVTGLQTDAHQSPIGIEISVSGTYPRPGQPGEAIQGGYKLLIKRDGSIEMSYSYTPVKATGELLEAGFALAIPKAHSESRWIGQGPYAGYPGKDRLNEYGLFHLNRDDLYFPGNRQRVELASLAAPSGLGVLLGGEAMTVDLESTDNMTILSHLALVPGQANSNEGGENVDVSARLKASSIKNIAGKFHLLPLGKPWPQPLTRWFGAPGAKAEITKPFSSSYDQ